MYVFSYKLKCDYYEDNEHEAYTVTGLGFADSYVEAIQQLEEQYGDEITEVLSLCLLDSAAVIALPEAAVEDYKSKDFPDIEYRQTL